MPKFMWSQRTLAAEQKYETDAVRLAEFVDNLLEIGSLQGFKHIELSIRSREELMLWVRTNYPDPPKGSSNVPANSLFVLDSTNPAHSLIYDSAIQKRPHLSADKFEDPKSLVDKDLVQDSRHTTFLIAAYYRYRCPYVWLRSNHEQLIQNRENKKLEPDDALKLDSTSCWKEYDIRPWDIVVEVVCQTFGLQLENPFALDYAYFDHLPLEEFVVRTGAMVRFLQRIVVRGYYFEADLTKDLEQLQMRHYEAFSELMSAKRPQNPHTFS
ncbi:hypothetical protein H4R34_001290 [Dimargaris verticillata]|uniref:DUF7886 domain-containing protein n=1 Tax=Dimargaris verticillata TaxID=2761393 RepID=A0A9W8B3W2_9FUNG|nr:hypothetical protein H4R34_001290 [Dimargaris verticillata]